MASSCGCGERFVTETVWDSGLAGTACAGDERSLAIGQDGAWMPEHLLLFAAEGCYMTALLTVARREGIEVLGYLSTAELRTPPVRSLSPSIVLLPCVVVGSDVDAARVRALEREAVAESAVARLLGDRLHVILDVRAIAAAAAAE